MYVLPTHNQLQTKRKQFIPQIFLKLLDCTSHDAEY